MSNENQKQFKHWNLTFIPRHKELYVYVNESSKDLSVFDIEKAIELRNFLNEFIEANNE